MLADLNSEAIPLCLFGAALGGKPFVPVNYRLTDEQLRAIVARTAPSTVIVGEGIAQRLASIDGVELATREDLLEASADEDRELADGWSGSGQRFEDAEQVLLEIARIRREAGRSSLPFEAVVPLPDGVTQDQRVRLVELGMTSTVSYPFPYTIGRDSTLQQKLDYLRRFGEETIARDRD